MDFYAYQRPLGKIEDAPEFRAAFVSVFDMVDKADAVCFGLLYGKRLLEITGFEPCEEIAKAFTAMERWLDGKTNYHEARNIAFADLYKKAREENDAVKERFYKTFAQIACIPHVKFHALWASDFAVTLINRMRPHDIEAVRKERQAQIDLIKSVGDAGGGK
jgi:hypothetical protein